MSEWREQAACRGVNPRVFYPTGSGHVRDAANALALALCGGCPVRC